MLGESFANLNVCIERLNEILFCAHSKELQLRQRQERLFEVTDDPNSDPLCHCFKDIRLRILDQNIQVFEPIEKQIEVNNRHYYHCFFSNGNIVIDPTFGQLLKKLNIKPEKFRKQNPDLFIDNIYVGLPQIRGINYF